MSCRPPLLEYTIHQGICIFRVEPPEAALAWLVFAARHLEEALVQRQVVTDGVLWKPKYTIIVRLNILSNNNNVCLSIFLAYTNCSDACFVAVHVGFMLGKDKV